MTIGKFHIVAVHFPAVSLSDSNVLANAFLQTISVCLVLRYSGPLPKSPLVSLLTYQFPDSYWQTNIVPRLMDLVGTFSAMALIIVLGSVSTQLLISYVVVNFNVIVTA